MSDTKPFLSYDEQIKHLINKGLIIDNNAFVKDVLSKLNYYRIINAYSLTLYDGEKYVEGTTFRQIYDLYIFDTKLRHILSELLEEFEIIFRTKLAYHIGKEYGALGYLNESIFEKLEYHKQLIDAYDKEKTRQAKSKIIKHHTHKYDGNLPVWAAVEVLSFGTVSKMYRNLKIADRTSIAKDMNTSFPYLNSWLRAAVEARNICAHYGRLYNKAMLSPPKMYSDFLGDNKYIFAVIYTLKRYSSPEQWLSIFVRLKAALAEHDCVDLKMIGFPDNWEELLG